MAPPPLAGLRIVELAGIGPGPFCGMMLADHGAEVIRIDRGVQPGFSDPAKDPLLRSRRSVSLDLKTPQGIAAVRRIAASADGLIEGFRPGVMERLGLGPDVLLADNPRLVYGRMTGWGQDGPMAQQPGHDINYIALSGTLHALGQAGGKPMPPINMVGDFGGGGMLLAFGMLAALLHAQRTGKGQVVDAAMTDGSALLMSMIWGFRAMGRWSDARGTNLLDGGAPFYDTYATGDGRWIAVGAIEPAFYAALRRVLGLDGPLWDRQFDASAWPAMRAALTACFLTRPRDAWVAAFDGTEACVTPVLDYDEAAAHPHNVDRATLAGTAGVLQPAPAPRYSASTTVPPAMATTRTDATLLAELGFSAGDIAALGH
ncbi:alpha-methylacyl-CoA racemase [Sphingomonas insulae]|uniref:CaiB/BaiF CoA-transferase family protein n=1 Tax=Sphingomonas insulae TaxID=424800 RepID=A0ABP3T3T4_9SPHN|nr:CaiB/BaiF CoA-transferase family protein [Sphingomonas insulae]NIJ29587.1 alpha-methylacyl-CoA racemase [Sphingomonas insulae]